MGVFSVSIEIVGPKGQRRQTEAIVDSGAIYSWLPEEIMDELGIVKKFKRSFRVATGQTLERHVGEAIVILNGESLTTLFIFGDRGSEALLGAYTLEGFGLGVDTVNKRLIPLTLFLI